MKAYGAVDVQLHSFLPFELDECEMSASCLGPFTLATHWTRDWVYPTVGLTAFEKTNISHSCQELNHESSAVSLQASHYRGCAAHRLRYAVFNIPDFSGYYCFPFIILQGFHYKVRYFKRVSGITLFSCKNRIIISYLHT
jgi:hypothetical protein